MEIIATGSRDWTNIETIEKVVAALIQEFGYYTLIHGAARGLDNIIAFKSKKAGITNIIPYPANWTKYGDAAGMIRNVHMLDMHPNAELLVAFPLLTSKGTYGMINEAKKRSYRIRIYDPYGGFVES